MQRTSRKQNNRWASTEEMADARDWLSGMLAKLCARRPQPVLEYARQGWGELKTGKCLDGTALCLAGKVYPSGFGTHSRSEIGLSLPPGSRRLTGLCGINDSAMTRGITQEQTFRIEQDGREIWNSGAMRVDSPPARFALALGQSRKVVLKIDGNERRAHVNWVDLKIDGQLVTPLSEIFGFRYGGKPSAELLPGWRLKKQCAPERDGAIRHRLTRTDPRSGLAVICDITEYTRYPAVEWVVRLKNTSKRKSPLIEDLRSMEIMVGKGLFPYLNYWTGDYCEPDGYEPFRVSLAHREDWRFAPLGGRGTNRAWPYYNLEWQDTQRGLIAVVGWAGQWESRFIGEAIPKGSVRISAGQQNTHVRLLPGEEIRTPTSLLMFYHGDKDRAQNMWRRWYRDHVMPRPGGEPMRPHLVGHGTDEGEEFTAATEENQKRYIAEWKRRGVPVDVWWIDAGWYPCYSEQEKRRYWPVTGTWRPDPERFPRGLKPVSDCAARQGADLLIWFEPERVASGTELDREHPEWLLKLPGKDNRLLNLGDPRCRRWITDRINRLIREQGIKIYRQDFNMEPLEYWRANDEPDRQGVTENLHIQGYLKFWDDLLARNPGLWIDSCASGGRRNDLDTMRRSVPLHYTDHGYGDHPVKLAFNNALFQWLPYFKEVSLSWDLRGDSRHDHHADSFSFHCAFGPMMMPCIDIRRNDYNYALIRQMIAIWRRVAPLMLHGDYYALTPIHRSPAKWVVRQFDLPEEGRGFIQGIRLPKAPAEQHVVYPRGLQAGAAYVFENPETGRKMECSAESLAAKGFTFALPPRKGEVWFYRVRK